jgi:hypothetical protein
MTVGVAAVLALVFTGVAEALSPGTDLLVPAAARTGGWVTDLYLFNPGDEAVQAEVHWLVRGQPNPDPPGMQVSLAPDETLVLEDVILASFGLSRSTGAFRISSTRDIVATCRIHASDGGGSVGQGFEAVPSTAATAAGTNTHVVGLSSNDAFRSNLYALATANGATVNVALHDTDGNELASTVLTLGTYQPHLAPVTSLFEVGELDQGTLFVTVTAGRAVVGASKVDNLTSDPTTLSSWIPGSPEPIVAGSYFGVVIDHNGIAGGSLTARFNGEGEMTGLELSYPSDRCPVLFAAGEDLSDDPLPLDDLADGHTFTSSYPGGGDMAWSLQLRLQSDGPTLSGELSAVGSSWTGEQEGCNGDHASQTVALGTWQP